MWVNASIRDDGSLPQDKWVEVPEQNDYETAMVQGLEALLPAKQPKLVHVSKTNPIGRAAMVHAFELEYPEKG